MSRRRRPDPESPVEEAIRRAGSIGALERLAGIASTHEGRFAFWMGYSHIHPAGASLDAGVAELERRIRARGPDALPGKPETAQRS